MVVEILHKSLTEKVYEKTKDEILSPNPFRVTMVLLCEALS